MKQVYLTLLLTFFFYFPGQAQRPAEQIDKLMDTYHGLRKFNGTILVSQKGRILLEKGYGCQDMKTRVPNSPQTIYQIASVTKPFTSTLVLKLVELQQLKLTDVISKFYPGFPKGDSITIRQLLSHTSGIVDHAADIGGKPIRGANEEEMFIETLKARPLGFSPGKDWRYSNSGYILLGYIIEKVSHMSYYDAIRKYIFKPAGMRQSAFDFVGLESPNKATGYWVFPEDEHAEQATLINYDGPKAAGAIYSTVGDLYKFHRGLQTGLFVSGASLKEAYTPVALNYGYGWIIEQAGGKQLVSHSGDIWGFKAEFARLPQDDVCIVVLSNAEEPDLHAITFKIVAILNGQDYQFPAQNKIKLSEEVLKGYAGKYELRPGEFIEVNIRKQRLTATTNITQELYCQQKDVFLLDNGTAQKAVTFNRGKAGQVISLSFINGEEKMVCKKVK